MSTAVTDLLRMFEQVGSPAGVLSPKPERTALAVLEQAVACGWIRAVVGKTPPSGVALWIETLVLTDDGLTACGLAVPSRQPPVPKAAPAKVVVASKQRDLF